MDVVISIGLILTGSLILSLKTKKHYSIMQSIIKNKEQEIENEINNLETIINNLKDDEKALKRSVNKAEKEYNEAMEKYKKEIEEFIHNLDSQTANIVQIRSMDFLYHFRTVLDNSQPAIIKAYLGA